MAFFVPKLKELLCWHWDVHTSFFKKCLTFSTPLMYSKLHTLKWSAPIHLERRPTFKRKLARKMGTPHPQLVTLSLGVNNKNISVAVVAARMLQQMKVPVHLPTRWRWGAILISDGY